MACDKLIRPLSTIHILSPSPSPLLPCMIAHKPLFMHCFMILAVRGDCITSNMLLSVQWYRGVWCCTCTCMSVCKFSRVIVVIVHPLGWRYCYTLGCQGGLCASPFPTSLLPSPSAPTCSMSAQPPPPILVLLTFPPSPHYTHPLPLHLLPILFSWNAFRDQPSVSLYYVPWCEEGIV